MGLFSHHLSFVMITLFEQLFNKAFSILRKRISKISNFQVFNHKLVDYEKFNFYNFFDDSFFFMYSR